MNSHVTRQAEDNMGFALAYPINACVQGLIIGLRACAHILKCWLSNTK